MKLVLLKVLLQRRARDEGFTLPVVIALGLIMILLGAVNILGAGEENLNAISDNQKNKALAIAEVGVARYRQFLDRNRMLTVYDSDDWSGVANTCNINSDISDAANTNTWQQVNDGSGNIGQYRIVSYTYDIDGNSTTDNNGQFAPNDDNGNTEDLITFNDITYHPTKLPADDPNENINGYNPRGILTIKSRAVDGSEAQVEVEIPIRINENDMSNLAPALWIGDRNITNAGIGNNLIIDGNRNGVPDKADIAAAPTPDPDAGNYGNIVLSQPATGSTPGCTPPADILDNTTISDPRPLPAIIPEPDPSLVNEEDIKRIPNNPGDPSNRDLRYGNFRGEGNIKENMLLLGAKEADPPPTPLLHKRWKTDANGFNYYFYKAPAGLTLDNTKLATDGQSRVVLYVDGDIDLSNNASLQAGSKFARGYKSVGLQVYVKGNRDITINPGGGTVRIKGLIHAPDSTVKITTGGTVLIEGAVWVKNWDNTGGANVTIIPDNAGVGSDKAYQHYLGTDNRAAKPITNAPTDWEVQEVDPD